MERDQSNLRVIDNDIELLDRAIAAFYRSRRKEGLQDLKPTGTSTVIEFNGKKYVVLGNFDGILSVYRVKNDGLLKRLKRWPKEIEEPVFFKEEAKMTKEQRDVHRLIVEEISSRKQSMRKVKALIEEIETQPDSPEKQSMLKQLRTFF